jgi:hypothetical protein
MWNGSWDLVRYFGENRRVTSGEWVAFWQSLSPEEKFYYHTVVLEDCK